MRGHLLVLGALIAACSGRHASGPSAVDGGTGDGGAIHDGGASSSDAGTMATECVLHETGDQYAEPGMPDVVVVWTVTPSGRPLRSEMTVHDTLRRRSTFTDAGNVSTERVDEGADGTIDAEIVREYAFDDRDRLAGVRTDADGDGAFEMRDERAYDGDTSRLLQIRRLVAEVPSEVIDFDRDGDTIHGWTITHPPDGDTGVARMRMQTASLWDFEIDSTSDGAFDWRFRYEIDPLCSDVRPEQLLF